MSVTEEEEQRLARAVMHVLDDWGLQAADILRILELPDSFRTRHLDRCRNGGVFPGDENVRIRIELVLGIAEALRTSYPRNSHTGVLWLNRPHRRFDNRTPLHTMVEDGKSGLMAIRAELDCGYAWDLSQPAHKKPSPVKKSRT